jgi:hypothetical protein
MAVVERRAEGERKIERKERGEESERRAKGEGGEEG